jgi:hypothetical protein
MIKESLLEDIPVWNQVSRSWSSRSFTNDEFIEFIESIFKEPGKYEFDETSYEFNAQGRKFKKSGEYCDAPVMSSDYIDYWDFEKNKSRKGVIFLHGDKTWYLGRDYYFWINFLRIYNKHPKVKDYAFADVRDVQYHLDLYETLAEAKGLAAPILKKRQIASSYYHAAKIINRYWFENGWVSKMGASDEKHINMKGTWKYLEEYRNFLNEHTAWYRNNDPNGVGQWQQQIETIENGRKKKVGNKSTIGAYSFKRDPTAGVGGACDLFFYEEGGIAPTMDTTVEYLFPAMKDGMIFTGLFVAAGSVGDLDQCKPLKNMINNPGSDYLGVETNLIDDTGKTGIRGLFIPEQWGMEPCIDKYGNSEVERALEMIAQERMKWKEELDEEKYQLRISQKPTTIQEAFASRKLSQFPLNLLKKARKNIEEGNYYTEYVDLEEDLEDPKKIHILKSDKTPIDSFPINPKTVNKESVIVMHERPDPKAQWGSYLASMDPVREGKTTTSESLMSIYIAKMPFEITRYKNGEKTMEITDMEIVAYWCGRFDDINDSHKLCELLIRAYNAYTLIENNVSLFIQHMIFQKLNYMMVPKDQILFLREIGANAAVFADYGWKNTGRLFHDHLIKYAKRFVKEKIRIETDVEGNVLGIVYGVMRIPDVMLINEMEEYEEGVNVDRLIAFTALVAFAQVLISSQGYVKKTEYDDKNLQQNRNSGKLKSTRTPFKNLGNSGSTGSSSRKRSGFRNLGKR